MVTKEQFIAYENVRTSGITNMWDVKKVIDLADTDLTKENCLEIMKNYSELKDKYKKN